LRVNPDIDARTHPYISTGLRETKFGVAHGDAERLYRQAQEMAGIELVGIGCHIGSLLQQAAPFVAAAERLIALVDRLERAGIRLQHIDVGGGIGIRYKDETPQPASAFVAGVLDALGSRPHSLILDPGRALVGNAGVLLTRVEYVKPGAA
jgi:diaminopimelate decarboxylase